MAFLKEFEHDIFLSYAHIDNLPEREGEKGWVEQFERQLSVHLLKRFGEPVAIWRDPKLARSQVFDQVIEEAVRGSGLMLSLITQPYLKSEYGAQEIKWFSAKAEREGGLVVNSYLRILPVLLYNIPAEQWPESCKGTTAFSFYRAEGDELGWPMDPASEEFQRALRQLVDEVHLVLTELGRSQPVVETEEPQAEPAGAAAEPGSGFSVFLAAAPHDLAPTQRRLAAALESAGVEVVAGVPPPYDEEGHGKRLREVFARTDLAVHLLSASAGEPFNEDEPDRTYPLEQARLGLEQARSQLILMPEEVEFSSVGSRPYAEFLASLTERERAADKLEVVSVSRPQMLDQILAKQRRLDESARRERSLGGLPDTAFIDVHTNDLAYITDLMTFLVGRKVSPLMVPSTELTPQMSLFEENLRKSSLFIVVFGAVARAWVEHRMQTAFKLILAHKLPTRIGVYVAPPEKPEAEVRFPPLCRVAVNTAGFDPETLSALLSTDDSQ